jgi:S1-C subfamily serine protease
MEIESSVTAEGWPHTLSRVVPAVTVLRTTVPRAFDTEVAGSSSATGFVVDKSLGIILTNRHIVSPGIFKPLTHRAIM